jgi:hypothetical protein
VLGATSVTPSRAPTVYFVDNGHPKREQTPLCEERPSIILHHWLGENGARTAENASLLTTPKAINRNAEQERLQMGVAGSHMTQDDG